MTEQSSAYRLKILSGLQAGAEAELADGGYVLGSADDADLIIADAAEHHARLTIGLQPTVTPLDGPVRRADGAEIAGETPLKPLEIFLIGGVACAIGASGSAWPVLGAGAATEVARPTAGQSAPPQPVLRRKDRILLLAGTVALGGLFVVVAAVTLLDGAGSVDSAAAAKTMQPPIERAKTVVSKLGLAGTVDVTETDGWLILDGYVPKTQERVQLVAALEADSLPVRSRLYAMSELVASVQAMLDGLGLPVEASGRGDGTIQLDGVVPERAKLLQAIGEMKKDVSSLPVLVTHVVALDTVLSQLEAGLVSEGLARAVTLKQEGNRIIAEGALDEAQRQAWAKVERAAAATLADHPGVVQTRFIDLPPLPALALQAVVGGPMPYAMLRDGRRLYEGASLDNGYFLKTITLDHLILSRNDQDVVVPLTNGKESP